MNRHARVAAVLLLKGIFYKQDNPEAFLEMHTNSYGALQDYFEVIGLRMVVYEEEGFAYLENIDNEPQEEEVPLPKLIVKRELSYKVSLLCVLLRERYAQFEMQNDDERAVISREEILSTLMLWLDIKFNETKVQREIDATIKKVRELGFLKKLSVHEEAYEIKSAIKAFVDASWLHEFDTKLQAYKEAKLWN